MNDRRSVRTNLRSHQDLVLPRRRAVVLPSVATGGSWGVFVFDPSRGFRTTANFVRVTTAHGTPISFESRPRRLGTSEVCRGIVPDDHRLFIVQCVDETLASLRQFLQTAVKNTARIIEHRHDDSVLGRAKTARHPVNLKVYRRRFFGGQSISKLLYFVMTHTDSLYHISLHISTNIIVYGIFAHTELSLRIAKPVSPAGSVTERAEIANVVGFNAFELTCLRLEDRLRSSLFWEA